MLRCILNKLGYISEVEAEARAQKRMIEAIRRIKWAFAAIILLGVPFIVGVELLIAYGVFQ